MRVKTKAKPRARSRRDPEFLPLEERFSAREKKRILSDRRRREEFKDEFIADWKADEPWRKDKERCGDFYDGDQWSKEEKAELEDRGQHPAVNNRIKPKVDSIIGITAEAKVDTKAFNKGDRQREEQVEAISEEFRSIEDESNFDEQELDVFKDQCLDGRGWYKTTKEWDGLQYRLKTEYADNENIVKDRFGHRKDMKDHRQVHEWVWMEIKDAKALFPGHDKLLESAYFHNPPIKTEGEDEVRTPDIYEDVDFDNPGHFEQFVDHKRKRIRVVTTFYREPDVHRFLLTPGKGEGGGDVTDVTDFSEEDLAAIRKGLPDASEWSQTWFKLNSVTFTWNAILEEKKDIKPKDREAKFPFVMVIAYKKRKTKQHVGIVKQMIDPQMNVNKRESKMLHLLNTNQTWFEEGAFEHPQAARDEAARPDAWMPYRKSFKVERITHGELAQAQFQLLQESKNAIDTAGVNREIEGRSSASSGRDYALRLREALKSIREVITNLRQARRRVAQYWLEDIIERNPDLARARYDIVVEEAADSVTLQQETFQSLIALAQSGKIPIPADILIEVAPLPPKMKNEMLKKLQEAEKLRQIQLQLAARATQQQEAVGNA